MSDNIKGTWLRCFLMFFIVKFPFSRCSYFNEVQHAPSADEHRRERAGIDAVVAELMEDRRELHFNFSEPFSP